MNRVELSSLLREARELAQYDPSEAIKLLCEIIKELNKELEEVRRHNAT